MLFGEKRRGDILYLNKEYSTTICECKIENVFVRESIKETSEIPRIRLACNLIYPRIKGKINFIVDPDMKSYYVNKTIMATTKKKVLDFRITENKGKIKKLREVTNNFIKQLKDNKEEI